MAAGAALAAKRGKKPKGSLRGASKSMASSMSQKQLEELAGTNRKKLPTRGRGGKAKSSGKTSGGRKSSGRSKKKSANSSRKKTR